MSRRIP